MFICYVFYWHLNKVSILTVLFYSIWWETEPLEKQSFNKYTLSKVKIADLSVNIKLVSLLVALLITVFNG